MVSAVVINMSVELFASIGLSETKARETLKNAVVSSLLQSIISKVRRDKRSFRKLLFMVLPFAC